MAFNMDRVLKRLAVMMSIVGLAGLLFWALVLWPHYWNTLPRSPDQAKGRIYADNFHGVVVYWTQRQDTLPTTQHRLPWNHKWGP
jgi:hypothetical protein